MIKGSAMLFSAVCTNHLLKFFLSIQNILARSVQNRAAADTFSTGQRLLRYFLSATGYTHSAETYCMGGKVRKGLVTFQQSSFPFLVSFLVYPLSITDLAYVVCLPERSHHTKNQQTHRLYQPIPRA